jgi:predicted deacylase
MNDFNKYTIDSIFINKGIRQRINLDMGRMHDFIPLNMPIEVIRGKKDGPTLFVSATIHGDEINGIEIIKRLLNFLQKTKINGMLIAIPIVNVFGFSQHSRYLPDNRDLNRCFPGLKNGSLASQLAYKFMQEIVLKSDYGIDIHTGSNNRFNYPQIRTNIKSSINLSLAKKFNAPVILNSNLRDGSLRSAVSQLKMPILLYEAGERLKFNEESIEIGVCGILKVMKKIKMLNKIPKIYNNNINSEQFIAKSSSWLRAVQSGIFTSLVKPGEFIQKDQVIGHISNQFGENRITVQSHLTGIVIGLLLCPLVNQGDALLHIGTSQEQVTKNQLEELAVFGQD